MPGPELDILSILGDAPTSQSDQPNAGAALVPQAIAPASIGTPSLSLTELKTNVGMALAAVITDLPLRTEVKERLGIRVQIHINSGVLMCITPESVTAAPALLELAIDDSRFSRTLEAAFQTNTPFKFIADLLKSDNLTTTANRDISEAIRLAAKVAGCNPLKWQDGWASLPTPKKEEAVRNLLEISECVTGFFEEIFAQRDQRIRDQRRLLPLLTTLYVSCGKSHEKLDALIKRLRGDQVPFKPWHNENNQLLQGEILAFHALKGASRGEELRTQYKQIWSDFNLQPVSQDEVTSQLGTSAVARELNDRIKKDFRHMLNGCTVAISTADDIILNAITLFNNNCGSSIDILEDKLTELLDNASTQEQAAKRLAQLTNLGN